LSNNFSLVRGTDRTLFQNEIALLDFALWALFEHDGSVLVFAHLFSPVA